MRPMLPRVSLLLVLQLGTSVVESFHVPRVTYNTPSRTTNWDNSKLLMALYEDEIDWDADLFGQIGKSNNKQEATGDGGVLSDDDLSDDKWDMGSSASASKSVKSARDQMRQLWGDGKKEEGKPTADWMPGYGGGPDDDEPWFTG